MNDTNTSKSESSPKKTENLVGILEKQLQQEVGCQDDDKNVRVEGQGMYKNTVKNDRIFFEIPALLCCEGRNPERENSI